MSKLAINGGPKVRNTLFPSQNTYGREEMGAVARVMNGGRLSWYRGNGTDDFYGGPEIRYLEEEWCKKWGVKHAICCNSATSGIHIALGALGIGRGDVVIVSPYSMTCSATMPLAWGATPIFADVEPDHFCIDPRSVEEIIKSRKDVKAIIAVSLFGQPFDPALRNLQIPIIEDAAQALGAKFTDENGIIKYAGTLGDIGVYSFNFGKHITCGEGGMIVTNNDRYANRCRLIMNHGESVINDQNAQTNRDLFGFNLRMTEIQAAIVTAQLEKFDRLLQYRLTNVKKLKSGLSDIPAITMCQPRDNCTHSYYALPFLWDSEEANGLHRDIFIEAVKAELTPRQGRDTEGVPIGCGYIKPIYQMPIFERYTCQHPIVESLWKDKLFLTLYHAPNSAPRDIWDVVEAFQKVWKYRDELR